MPNFVTFVGVFSSRILHVNLRGQKSPGIPYTVTSYIHSVLFKFSVFVKFLSLKVFLFKRSVGKLHEKDAFKKVYLIT